MRRLLLVPVFATLLGAQAAPEPIVSVGHTGEPFHAVFVGGYLATGEWSTVALIDLSTGLTVGRLQQGSLIQSMDAGSTNELLAVGTCDHAIRLWNVKTRTLVRRFTLAQECADSVSLSPDGSLLASAAVGGCCSKSKSGLQVWDVRDGRLVREVATGSGLQHVAFSGDGRWIVTVDDTGKAAVFEWPSGRELRVFQGLEMPGWTGSAAVASRDGRYFAWLWKGGGLRLFDVASGSEVTLPAGGRRDFWPDTAEFLNDGRLAYVDDDRLHVRELPDGAERVFQLAEAQTRWFGDVGAVLPQSWLGIRRDGLLVAGGDQSGAVLWDVSSVRLRDLTSPALVSPGSLRWSRTGLIAWTDLGSGVRIWDDRVARLTRLGTDLDSGESLAFRPDGERVAVSGSTMRIFNLASRRVVASRELTIGSRTSVAFSPDGSRLAFASPEGFSVFDGNLRPLRRLTSLEGYTDTEHVAFSPDGRWIAAGIGGPSLAIRVWPAVGDAAAVTLDAERVTYGPQPPAFSGDSRWLASFTKGKTVTLWSPGTWTVARTWSLSGTGRALAFAPRGTRVAIASDGEAAIWDAETGRKLMTLSAPGSNEMREIAWSPDGRRLVSSADDGILRFWSSSDGRLLASLYVVAQTGDWLLVSPDGRVDGTSRALTTLVAWREGERVSLDGALTQRRRVRGLWRLLLGSG